jgi:hypothetical protein
MAKHLASRKMIEQAHSGSPALALKQLWFSIVESSSASSRLSKARRDF